MKDMKISKAAFEAWYGPDSTTDVTLGRGEWSEGKRAAWDAWQAALASPEVQALRKNVERYRWLRNQAEGWYIGTAYDTYNDVVSEGEYNDFAGTGEMLDAAIDAAMEKQK